uniref:Uncharacterized protein n=1 Tax=viral metagenome TaxID=1070528 RepID=A0A6M3X5W7_9ZZZZ
MTEQKTKMWKKGTEQYEKGSIPTDHPNYCSHKYPHCKIHGALLAYKNNIYRCIECGWAIKRDKDGEM